MFITSVSPILLLLKPFGDKISFDHLRVPGGALSPRLVKKGSSVPQPEVVDLLQAQNGECPYLYFI